MSEIYLGKPSQKIIDWCKKKYEYKGLCFTAEEDGSWIEFLNVAGTYATSKDGLIWTNYELGAMVKLNKGEIVYFAARNTNETCWNNQGGLKFIMSGKIRATGSIQSLLDKKCKRMDVPVGCYMWIFRDCTALTQAPELPATTLANDCYAEMFHYCSSLVKISALKATTLAAGCYYSMFEGCTKLKISENSEGGTEVLNLPSSIEIKESWSTDMFLDTAGTFKGSPEIGKTYRCYQ